MKVSGDTLTTSDGKPLRLFGMNVGFGQLDQRGAFEFLSSMGVNIIRVIPPYRTWGKDGEPEISSSAPLELSKSSFQRLCLQQKICEELGIYILFRDFAQALAPPYYTSEDASKYPYAGRKDSSVLGFWHPGIRTLVIERLKRLVRTINPLTGKPFGASPAFLGVQLTNEAEWFASDVHTSWSRKWPMLKEAPERIINPLAKIVGVSPSQFRQAHPAQRLLYLAKVTNDAYTEAMKVLVAEMGNQRPLIIADNAPYAGAMALEAFKSCDVFGLNMYPDVGNHEDVNGPIKANDLRRERFLDRLQARLSNKPTLITEAGDKLAAGGFSRLIADMTVRCSRAGYSGIIFHEIFRGIYGDDSGKPKWLESRTPRFNFELQTDPGALVAFQACSIAFREGLIPPAPTTVKVSRSLSSWAELYASRRRQTEDMTGVVADVDVALARQIGAMSTSFMLALGDQRVLPTTRGLESGVTIEQGHLRTAGIEMDWSTNSDSSEDWLYIRVPLRKQTDLIVVVGRSKPEPATQSFRSGHANLSGYKQYPWPDPRTGYGDKQVVRRPDGPRLRLEGAIFIVNPDGSRGLRVTVSDPSASFLPKEGIRFVEINEKEKIAFWRMKQ